MALLVGPDAPLVLEPARSWRSVYSGHADEFLKPFGAPHAYPVIDGRATLLHFLTAVDRCGHALLVKRQQYEATATAAATADSEPADRPASSGRPDDLSSRPAESTSRNAVSPPPPGRLLGSVDHFVCHAPFHRLVRKAFSRLHYQDLLHATHNWRRRDDSGGAGSSQDGVLRAGGAAAAEPSPAAPPVLSSARDTPPLLSCGVMRPDWLHGVDPARLGQASVEDRDLAAALLQLSQAEFEAKGSQAAAAQVLTGNSYTASLYTGLAGLVEWLGGSRLAGRRVLMFAFGSGVNASLFALRCRDASTAQGAVAAAAAATVSGSAAAAAAPPADVHDFRRKYSFSLARIAQQLQLERRLARRTLLSPREYDKACALHQQALLCPTLPYQPHGSIDDQSLSPGTWYLERIGEDRRRCYAQKPDGS